MMKISLLLMIVMSFFTGGCMALKEKNVLSDKLVKLEIDESKEVIVVANEKYNKTGILMAEGENYKIEILVNSNWKDGSKVVEPKKGWDRKKEKLGIMRLFVWIAEPFKRVKGENWFALCGGMIGSEGKEFVIDFDKTYTAIPPGELYIFANDLWFKYNNNTGFLKIKITRVGKKY